MVIALWTVVAIAGPVVCDDLAAAELLAEARLDEARAPVTHPELIPGLALASSRTDPALRAALTEFCSANVRDLALAATDRWEGADGSAHAFILTRGEMRGCTLSERAIAISVGVRPSATPQYSLLARMPVSRTPVGDCPSIPVWRDERLLDGGDGPVRLVLVQDHDGDALTTTELVVREASPQGWKQTILLDPAPPRLSGGVDGPLVELTSRFEEKWVVTYANRTGGDHCRQVPGQVVWTPTPNDPPTGWAPHEGRAALNLLARRGLWRLAGEDGWFLIIAQGDEAEGEQLQSRIRRLAPRVPDWDGDGAPDPLEIFESAMFPGLNAGFLVIAPAPWPTEQQARDAAARWRPRRQAYVKQAWRAIDACTPNGTLPDATPRLP
jgi:hypothetical protein